MSARLPSHVWVGPVRFSITRDGRSEIAAQVHDARAVTVTARAAIELDPQLPASTTPVTVLHELLHALFDNGIGYLLDGHNDKLEEQVIQMLAAPLLDMLRSNPDMVEYLTEWEPSDDDE